MKIGYHAPPPQSRSGVADYAETLRMALEREGVFADSNAPALHVFHIGNNGLHAEIYEQALRNSGIVVLHDAVLHHFLLGHLSRERYLEEFVYNYGEWRRDIAEQLWQERGGSAVDSRYFQFPMLRRLAERSEAVIAHNPAAAHAATAHGAANVHIIPHFLSPRALSGRGAAARFRQQRGIPPGAVLYGVFGYLRETKRIIPVIRGFQRLHAVYADSALLIAGQPVSADLARLLETEADHAAIFRAGFLAEPELYEAAAAIDCCINLRYPGAGETSGITMRMAGAGVPLIVTENQENSLWPAASCLRVRPGVAEAEDLFDHMSMVARFPHLARAIGEQARQHVARHHSLESVARQYRDLLCAFAS